MFFIQYILITFSSPLLPNPPLPFLENKQEKETKLRKEQQRKKEHKKHIHRETYIYTKHK